MDRSNVTALKFVKLAAIFVGLANALAFSVPLLFERSPLSWLALPAYTSSAVVAGLLVSRVVIGPARRFLEGGFFARYALIVLGVFLGGMLTGVLLSLPLLCRSSTA